MSNLEQSVPAERNAAAVPFSAGTALPALVLPENACDCHMHVYDSRCPVAPGATLTPPDASVDDYALLQHRLGTTRVVVVTPSTYGTDNSVMIDALARFGASGRGVAVASPSISDRELEQLHQNGVRGLRFNLARGAHSSVDDIEPLAARIADMGWHVQILMNPDALLQCKSLFGRISAPLVFDHFGRIGVESGTRHPAFNLIEALLNEGRAWVKLSGAYLLSKEGMPGYGDIRDLARAFINAAPDRVVWGSDWPHAVASMGERPMPDDARLLDLLLEWTDDEHTRKRILVDNPAILYGFQ